AATIVKWHGAERPRGLEWPLAFAPARAGARDAAPGIVAVARDREIPPLVRATALGLLRGYPGQGTDAVTASPSAPAPAVRAAAVAALESAPPAERLAALTPLLKDSTRAVRIETARVLASVPPERFDRGQRAAFDSAAAEFVEAQHDMADMPAS